MTYQTTQLANGKFDVQDEQGASQLEPFGGPYHTQEAAEATERMLTSFDAVDGQIRQVNTTLAGLLIAPRPEPRRLKRRRG